MPPRLVNIRSGNPNGLFGTGEIVYIDLEFSDNVFVHGIPSITLNTGCFDQKCQVKEIQSFICTADKGMFGLRLENQFISNLDVNTTQDAFKLKLEELVGIGEVTIDYDDSTDREYSYGRRICNSKVLYYIVLYYIYVHTHIYPSIHITHPYTRIVSRVKTSPLHSKMLLFRNTMEMFLHYTLQLRMTSRIYVLDCN